MNDDEKEIQEQIDIELLRYKEIMEQIEAREASIRKQMKNLEDLVNSYFSAIKIIQPKMDSWRNSRREKVREMAEKLRQKWSSTQNAAKYDPSIEQEERLHQAVVKIQFKKHADLQAFKKKRQILIQNEINKLKKIGQI